MSREEMCAAFDTAAAGEFRRLHTRRDVVNRLRKAILDGEIDYDPCTDRVSITARGRAKMRGLRVIG